MNGTVTERELLSQPRSWQTLLTRVRAPEALPRLRLDDFDEIVVFGSGTSYYLALLLAELLYGLGQRVRALPSCELFLNEGRYLAGREARRLGVGISRSGESSEALIAAEVLKAHGAPLLAVGCDAASTLPRQADFRLVVLEGREDGMVMLRSFTSMLLGFQLFLARAAGSDKPDIDKSNTDKPNIDKHAGLPAAGERVLEQYRPALKTLANRSDFRRFVVLGSGLHYPLAREAALKFQEMAIVTSEAYHTLEYRHGPKATAGTDTLVVLFDSEGHSDYGLDLLEDLTGYGVTSLVVGETAQAYQGVADEVVALESGLSEAARLVLALLPVQLLALETAFRLGQNPDSPRNLSPVVRF